MKGAMGLAVAAGLGIVGAICNWFYLAQLARDQEKVSFIAVAQGVSLNVGDVIQEAHLLEVQMPKSGMGNLNLVAPLWSAKASVVGERTNTALSEGTIVLQMHLVTPASLDLASTLQKDEVARWVPINSRAVVPQQINPGDLVSFEVPRTSGIPDPTPAAPLEGAPTAGIVEGAPTAGIAAPGYAASELIGPFRVLALGNRRERPNVQEAGGRRTGSESTITIVAKLINGQLEPQAARLFDALRLSGNQGAYVQLHSSRGEPGERGTSVPR